MRYGVNVKRTVAVDHTLYVHAKSPADARAKVQAAYDEGRAGEAYVEFKGAKGIWLDPEGQECTEVMEVEDAYPAAE